MNPVRRRELHPRRLLHRLRWHLASRESLVAWADRRIQLDDKFWLFLLGLNNSGTTVLWRILSTHPEIRSLPGEGQTLSLSLPRAWEYGVTRIFSKRPDIFRRFGGDDPEAAHRVRYDWAYFVEPGSGIVVEKSPQDSGRSLWLQSHFRPSRFLVLFRNPYAVCEGIRRRRMGSIEEAARHWVTGNQFLLDDKSDLEHHLVLTYEDLCRDTENILARIQSYLELEQPFDLDVIQQPLMAGNMDGHPQPLQDFNDRSIARLSKDEIGIINKIAGPLMSKLGYAPITDPAAPRTP